MSTRLTKSALAVLGLGASVLAGCDVAGDSLCGMVIDEPGTYAFTVTSDATCAGDGITIDGSGSADVIDVTIDLDGHSLSTPAGAAVNVNAVYESTNVSVTLENGSIDSSDNIGLVGGGVTLTNLQPLSAGGLSAVLSAELLVQDSTIVDTPISSSYDSALTINGSDLDGSPVHQSSGPFVQIEDTDVHGVEGTALYGAISMLGGSLYDNGTGFAGGEDGTGAGFAFVDVYDNDIGMSIGAWQGFSSVNWTTIRDNRIGVQVSYYGAFRAENSHIRDNTDHAIVNANTSTVYLDNVLVTGNGFGVDGTGQGHAITLDGFDRTLVSYVSDVNAEIVDSTITGNAGHAVHVDTDVPFPGTAPYGVTITNTTLAPNGLPGCGGFAC